jgi:hypothetical protein
MWKHGPGEGPGEGRGRGRGRRVQLQGFQTANMPAAPATITPPSLVTWQR